MENKLTVFFPLLFCIKAQYYVNAVHRNTTIVVYKDTSHFSKSKRNIGFVI